MNIIKLQGKLAAEPELRTFGNGSVAARLELSVVSSYRGLRRVDVVPVTVWEPDRQVLNADRGSTVEVEGSVHRRFYVNELGRNSVLSVVADAVKVLRKGSLYK